MSDKSPSIALSIAGSDCSAGAGIQADLKTFHSLGCYGLTALTGVVAEIPGHVTSIETLTPGIIRDQLALLLKSYPVGAIKTGALFSGPIIEAVAEVLGNLKEFIPLVIDPVMVASSGDTLLLADAISAYRTRLFPLATLITPNLDELRVLTEMEHTPSSFAEMQQQGHYLIKKINVPLLLKGGHLQEEKATDLLLMQDGSEEFFSAPYLQHAETHGTGCTYSAAITASLAQGISLLASIKTAKTFITEALIQAHQWGRVRALRHSCGTLK